jgi:hypothetical protein
MSYRQYRSPSLDRTSKFFDQVNATNASDDRSSLAWVAIFNSGASAHWRGGAPSEAEEMRISFGLIVEARFAKKACLIVSFCSRINPFGRHQA